jgi:hypothetical protein
MQPDTVFGTNFLHFGNVIQTIHFRSSKHKQWSFSICFVLLETLFKEFHIDAALIA